MGAVGQRLRLRLFIEGVEVPIIAASVQVVPNAPAQCALQIPPLPEGTRLLPRSLVHLFFFDYYEAASPFATASGAFNPSTNQSPTTYDNLSGGATTESQTHNTGDDPDLRNARYKLLFGGEVVGFQWTKDQAQRSLVLQCLDWSNYWDYAYQWNNTDLFGPGIKAMFSGGSTNLFTDFLEEEGSAILRIINTPSIQYPKLQGLLGGIVHLLEAIGGSYSYGKTIAGQNTFFSLAELRLHVTQMITAYEADPTSARLIGAGYDNLFGRTLGGLGQQVSIRQAINALMGIIFHETYAQPSPMYVPGSGNTPAGTTRTSVRKDPDNGFVAGIADAILSGIESVQSTIAVEEGGEEGSSETARISVRNSIAEMRKTCRTTIARITAKPILPCRGFYASALRSLDVAQTKAAQWKPGANANIVGAIYGAFNDAQKQLQRAAEFEIISRSAGVIPARLQQQIFRPDVWFTAPPRNNVIFPEHYTSLNYSRSFLQEPTRLLLKTNDEFFGEDELFDKFYFAPKGFTIKGGGRELQNILANDILDHELFTGILPVFEKMGELNIFGARSGTVKGGGVPKIGLAQRTTNFLYFKYRFAARQLSLSGRFNPYLAPGFPALVIDKYVGADALAQRQALIAQNGGVVTPDMNSLLGTHFLCNLTEVSHSVSQNAGSTTLNCSYARQYEESVEFLGVIRPDQTVHKRADKDATRVSVVAAIEQPQGGGLGPNQGRILSAVDVTLAYKAQDARTGVKLPLYQGPTREGTTQARIRVPVGLALPASVYGSDVAAFIGDPNTVVEFRAFNVKESVPRYRKETVDLPAEEYIRPGWYGDIWHPSQIGQAYQSFFGTGSITDEQQVDAGGLLYFGATTEAAHVALQEAQKAIDADDPAAHGPGLLAVDTDSSVQSAVAFLVQTYSFVKVQGLDTDDFIRNYTWRPIATMVDLFGTTDLALDENGHAVVQGIEGFHSRAFGPYDDLFGLTTPDIENVVGIKRGSTAAMKADIRWRRQRAVQEYVSQLQFARAILG